MTNAILNIPKALTNYGDEHCNELEKEVDELSIALINKYTELCRYRLIHNINSMINERIQDA
jgi:hypothetical protein